MQYGYDSLYRLTSETISGAATQNGAITYTYDSVGNRTSMGSTVPVVPAGTFFYDANDRLGTDVYDADGNTVASGALKYVYDFENHLVQQGGATFVYDGDGNRVQKVVAGNLTNYFVDTVNPTGYAQVLGEETASDFVDVGYVWGLELIFRGVFNGPQSYYVHDGHGSVRALSDPSGNVTDTYDYDAFGNLLHQTGTTQNNYLFAGEQFDPNLNLYYNRARYLSTNTGRFWTMDTDEGDDNDPLSLHKYLYVEGDPVDNLDPSGNQIDAVLDAFSQLNAATLLTYINSGTDKVPLSGTPYNIWTKLIAKAETDIFNADCQCFLNAHGLDAESVLFALETQVPYDGTRSKINRLNAGVYPANLSTAAAETFEPFKEPIWLQFQGDPRIKAEAQAHGDVRTDVYYRPWDFNEITIEHESLHNLTGKSDSDLAGQLGKPGLSGDEASIYISDALSRNRCDKPTAKKKR